MGVPLKTLIMAAEAASGKKIEFLGAFGRNGKELSLKEFFSSSSLDEGWGIWRDADSRGEGIRKILFVVR